MVGIFQYLVVTGSLNSFVLHKEYIKCADLITRSAHFAFLNFSCKLKADTQLLKAHDY